MRRGSRRVAVHPTQRVRPQHLPLRPSAQIPWRRLPELRRPDLLTPAPWMLLVALPLMGLAAGYSAKGALLLAGLIVGGGALLRLPRHWLPSLALGIYALVPVKYLLPDVFATASPSLFVLLVWAVRLLDQQRLSGRRLPRVNVVLAQLALVAGAWLLLSALISREADAAVGWVFSFALLVLLPFCLAGSEPLAGPLIIRVFAVLAGALSLLAALEAYVLQANPLLGDIYANARNADAFTQIWSVYRATTTLGFPLVNGAFFCVGLPLAVGLFLSTGRRRWLGIALLTAVGLAATSSRGAAVAAVAGVAATIMLHLRPRSPDPRRVAAAAIAVIALGGVAIIPFTQRASDAEGAASASYRLTVLEPGLRLVAEHPLTGLGSGAASYIKGQDPSLLEGLSRQASIPDLSFENSWLELLLGAGLPGLLLVAALLFGAVRAAGTRRPGAAGALVAWMVVAASFNYLDGHRPAHMVLGALAFAALSHPRKHAPGPPATLRPAAPERTS